MTAPTIERDEIAGIEEPRRGRRRVKLIWLTLGAIVLAGGGGAAYLLTTDSDSGAAPEDSTAPVATAEVVQETISDAREFDGTLGHGNALTVTTPGQGVVTRTADQNSAVERGMELFRLNEQPVTALYGAVPMYRDLASGATGADVKQLINNLTDLGYADCESTNEFDWCVQEAVLSWQDDIGVDTTGSVAQDAIAFVPKDSRVDTVHAGVGSVVAPGAEVVDLTGSDQVVSLDVEVADRDLLTVDTEVTVSLPGEEVKGTVTATNTVAAEPEGGGGGDEEADVDDAVTEVEVTLNKAVDDSLLGGPADVSIEVDERADVLTVPVNALLALADGGHGVEVVAADGSTEIVPVDTGLFADGKVEVSGSGVEAGTVVGVAGR